MDDDPAFNPTDFALREASVAVMDPFIFLNADPRAEPLTSYLGSLPDQLVDLGVDMTAIASDSYSRVMDRVYECNWKIAVENGMECYHCAVAHPAFADTVDLNQWQIGMDGNCVTHGARMKSTRPSRAFRPGMERFDVNAQLGLQEEGSDFIRFYFIFPNQTIQIWPGPARSFSIGRFVPMGPDKVRRIYIRYWGSEIPKHVADESWNFTMQVAQQDQVICEGVQAVMHSGSFNRGRFQLVSEHVGEHGTQRMNRLLLDHLLAAAEDGRP